ncbi:MAG TPA: J domain-containing protein, partial [Myxococcota bacterium]|nr:J domain-containing protein [Myxococcota bacterium]
SAAPGGGASEPRPAAAEHKAAVARAGREGRDAAAPSKDLTEAQRQRIDSIYHRLGDIDYFSLLEIAPGATQSDVKRAYFKLSKEFHPDRYHHKDLGEYRERLVAIFKELSRAYKFLGDEKNRTEYVGALAAQQQGPITPLPSTLAQAAQKAADAARGPLSPADLAWMEATHVGAAAPKTTTPVRDVRTATPPRKPAPAPGTTTTPSPPPPPAPPVPSTPRPAASSGPSGATPRPAPRPPATAAPTYRSEDPRPPRESSGFAALRTPAPAVERPARDSSGYAALRGAAPPASRAGATPASSASSTVVASPAASAAAAAASASSPADRDEERARRDRARLEDRIRRGVGGVGSAPSPGVMRSDRARRYLEAGKEDLVAERYARAANAFKLALSYNPDDEEIRQLYEKAHGEAQRRASEQLIRRADMELSVGDVRLGAQLYDEAAVLAPTATNLHRAAVLLLKAGDNLHRAQDCATRAAQAEPQKAEYRLTLARVYIEAGLLKNAAREVQMAQSLAPDDEEIRAEVKVLKKRL